MEMESGPPKLYRICLTTTRLLRMRILKILAIGIHLLSNYYFEAMEAVEAIEAVR